MMNMIRSKRGTGFTLIELMIVIAIIGILAAIAVPNFNRARSQAKKKACVSNMKTIEGAVELYLMEKNVANGTNVDLKTLRTEGYLKTDPTCPANGQYTIKVNAASGTTAGATEIKCNIHQGIDDTTSGL